MVKCSEKTQPVISLEKRPFYLHLPARQWPAGGEALWAGQELCPGFNLVSDHLQALLLRTWSCAHTMGLCGHTAGVRTLVCWMRFIYRMYISVTSEIMKLDLAQMRT